MKKILLGLLAALLIPVVGFADDTAWNGPLPMGNYKWLSSRSGSTFKDLDILRMNSSGDTEINAPISGRSVILQANKTTIGSFSATGSTIPPLITTSETVAGAGTTVSDAAQLAGGTTYVHRITGANGTVGWKFATTTPIGSVQILLNTTAGVAKIYGEAGSTVNGGSADAAFSALTGIKPIICIKTAALTYLCS